MRSHLQAHISGVIRNSLMSVPARFGIVAVDLASNVWQGL
jgi:hypothetical protein